MGSGSYFPPPVKALPAPGKIRGTRIANRCGSKCPTVFKMVPAPLVESVFDREPWGYRPGHSVLNTAVAMGQRYCDWRWSVESDTHCLLNNIDHGLLLRTVRKRYGILACFGTSKDD